MERIKHHYFIYLCCLLNKLTLKGVITYDVNDVQNRNRPQATQTALSPRFPNGYHYPVFLLRVCRATKVFTKRHKNMS